jgi:putative peptidoglycan lipid II flippase
MAPQGLITATALVAGSLLTSRVLGLLRNSIFAALFGTGADFKAYNAAFRVPDLLFTLIAGGALASAFIPVFAGLLERNEEEQAWRIANTVLNTLLVVMIGVALVAFLLAPQITDVLVSGFTPQLKAETADLTRIMLVQPILLGIGGLFAAMQNSYQRFVLPAVGPLVYNLAIILGAVIFAPHFGVYAAAWAVVVGALLMFEIQIWGVAVESRYFRFSINWRLPEAREVLRLLGPRLIGLSAFQVMLLVTTYLASSFQFPGQPPGLTDAGFNSITYAWALIMFPVGAIGSAVGTAIFPTLSRQSAAAQTERLEWTIRTSLRAIVFLALPATVGLILLRRPIITLLYDYGKWSQASTDATAFALMFYALAIVPLSSIEIIARAFYAMKNTLTPVLIAVVAMMLDAVLSILFIRFFSRPTGQGGLALATAAATWVQLILLTRALHGSLGGIANRDLRKALTAIAIATLVMGVAVFVTLRLVGLLGLGGHAVRAFIEVAVSIGIGLAVYIVMARMLRLPEVERLESMLSRAKTFVSR